MKHAIDYMGTDWTLVLARNERFLARDERFTSAGCPKVQAMHHQQRHPQSI